MVFCLVCSSFHSLATRLTQRASLKVRIELLVGLEQLVEREQLLNGMAPRVARELLVMVVCPCQLVLVLGDLGDL